MLDASEERIADLTGGDQLLLGNLALITGASSGIGRAVAVRLAGLGARIVALGRREEALKGLCEEIDASAGGQPENSSRYFVGDVRDGPFLDSVLRALGAIDILVTTAGVVVPAPFLEADPNDWRAMLETNVLAAMSVCQKVSRQLVDSKRRGQIILIGSALSSRPTANAAAYSACKAAVSMFGRSLRLELAPHGIRVTEISPGLVGDTDFKRYNNHPALARQFDERPYKPISSRDVARSVAYALTSPPGVGVDFLELMPEGQF
ncbi:SDR family oxidoreductase [Pelagibius marinus]|uniref:SDR family oxidoreductase n=1 Tax=Pelagibius marinus TaxID=2762760 RepID=UPI0018725F98|nr:SDR family oxidoreductase [Pelagibius marinus]